MPETAPWEGLDETVVHLVTILGSEPFHVYHGENSTAPFVHIAQCLVNAYGADCQSFGISMNGRSRR